MLVLCNLQYWLLTISLSLLQINVESVNFIYFVDLKSSAEQRANYLLNARECLIYSEVLIMSQDIPRNTQYFVLKKYRFFIYDILKRYCLHVKLHSGLSSIRKSFLTNLSEELENNSCVSPIIVHALSAEKNRNCMIMSLMFSNVVWTQRSKFVLKHNSPDSNITNQ